MVGQTQSAETSFKDDARRDLKIILAQNGAIVTKTINPRVTHLICEAEDTGDSIDVAQEHGLRLLFLLLV